MRNKIKSFNIKQLILWFGAFLFSLNLVIASDQEHFEQGNALVAQGKFEEAIKSYDLAIKYQPDYANAYYIKALL